MTILNQSVLYFRVFLTVLVGILFSIFPIPSWAIPFWPDWPILIIICWCLILPSYINIKFAWFVGIFIDLVKGSLIGQHALTYVITAYLIIYFSPFIRSYSILQRTLFIGVLLIPFFLLSFWINGILYTESSIWKHWTPLLSSILIWPWVFSLLCFSRNKIVGTLD